MSVKGGLLVFLCLSHLSSFARADGGTVRLSEQQGEYRITVFTAPTPLRVGPVDVSVLVQDAATGELAAGVEVALMVMQRGSTCVAFRGPATTQTATNKLYHAAVFDLPEPGWYSLEVSIAGTPGKAQVRFELEATEALPSWLAMSPWFGWPLLAIAVFSVHQLLIRWRFR